MTINISPIIFPPPNIETLPGARGGEMGRHGAGSALLETLG